MIFHKYSKQKRIELVARPGVVVGIRLWPQFLLLFLLTAFSELLDQVVVVFLVTFDLGSARAARPARDVTHHLKGP